MKEGINKAIGSAAKKLRKADVARRRAMGEIPVIGAYYSAHADSPLGKIRTAHPDSLIGKLHAPGRAFQGFVRDLEKDAVGTMEDMVKNSPPARILGEITDLNRGIGRALKNANEWLTTPGKTGPARPARTGRKKMD